MVRSIRAGGSGRLARRAARGSEYRCAPSIEVRASWAFRAVIERIVIGCSRSSIIIVPPHGTDRAVGERVEIGCTHPSIQIVPPLGTNRACRLARASLVCARRADRAGRITLLRVCTRWANCARTCGPSVACGTSTGAGALAVVPLVIWRRTVFAGRQRGRAIRRRVLSGGAIRAGRGAIRRIGSLPASMCICGIWFGVQFHQP